jgi:hypothetical protein
MPSTYRTALWGCFLVAKALFVANKIASFSEVNVKQKRKR